MAVTRASAPSARGFKPDDVVVAIMSFASAAFPEVIREGAVLRADHIAVERHPEYFVRQGATDAEKHAARLAVSPYERPDWQREIDEKRAREAKQAIPLEERVVATTAFSAQGRYILQGSVLRQDDPVVVANPGFFARPLA